MKVLTCQSTCAAQDNASTTVAKTPAGDADGVQSGPSKVVAQGCQQLPAVRCIHPISTQCGLRP